MQYNLTLHEARGKIISEQLGGACFLQKVRRRGEKARETRLVAKIVHRLG